MPLVALALVLTAAVMHAGWNLIVKQAKQRQVFFWWSWIIGVICFSLVFFTQLLLPARAWPYVITSAALEAAYFLALTWAYDTDDFSLTYPIARGAAPGLLLLWSALFLGETPHPGGLFGIALLILGLLVVSGGSLWSSFSGTRLSLKGILAALMAAICISLYSVIDGAAVRFVPAVPYTVMVLAVSALMVTPIVLWRYGPRMMLVEWQVNRWRLIFVGICVVLTYVLVLQAYSMARVSYGGTVREVSVVFAALAGWLWLGERFGLFRTIGSVLIFAGIVVIAVAG